MATDLERLTVLIEANTKSYENAMLRLQQKTDKAIRASNKSVSTLNAQFKTMSATAQKAAGILGISLGATAFVGLIKGAVEAGSKVGDLANQLGITAEQVQEFSFAAAQSGSSQEGFAKAMTAMARVLGDAQRGLLTAQREFAALGISMADLKGMNPGQVFELIIQQIGKLSDPLQRNAALIKFFGRSGVEMAEMVKIGAAGIDQLRQKARDLGLVLSNEEIAKLKEAGDQIDIIGQAGQAAGERMAIAFLPAIESLANLVTSPEFQKGLSDTAGWLGSIVKLLLDNPNLIKDLGAAAIGYKFGGVPGAVIGGVGSELITGGANMASRYADEMSPGKARFLGDFAQSNTGSVTPADILKSYKRVPTGGLPGFTDPAIDRQQKVYEKLAASLSLAQANLFATDREQAIANDLARLGTDATQKQRDSIEQLSGQLFDEKKKLADFNAEAQFFGQTLYDAFDALIIQGDSLNDVLGNMLKSLAQAVLQASLLGQGPLASLFGTAPTTSGGLGGLFGAIFGGFRAGGGSVDAGKAYVVGEKRPELFIPNTSGVIAANSNSAGGGRVGIDISVSVDQNGNIVPLVTRVAGATADVRIAGYRKEGLRTDVQKIAASPRG